MVAKECQFCLGGIADGEKCVAVDHFIQIKGSFGNEWLEPSGTTYLHEDCLDEAKKDPNVIMSGGEAVMDVLERVNRGTN